MRSWLLSILHNTFIDTRRKRGAEMRRDAEAAQRNQGSAGLLVSSPIEACPGYPSLHSV
jgi:DNA-directed RNA polymerase specialized sigma24 family protein